MSETSVLLPAAKVTVFSTEENSHQVALSLREDWRYARVEITVQEGQVDDAIQFYRQQKSPDLLVIQTNVIDEAFIDKLGALAESCSEGTEAIIIGPDNDVQLYRKLISMGVSDYMVRPLEASVFSDVIAKTLIAKLGVTGSRLIVTVGGRGGIGTSTITQALATALSGVYGQKTLLMDAAGGWSPNTVALGLEPSTTLAEAAKAALKGDREMLKRMILKVNDKLGILASGGDVMLEKPLERDGLEALLNIAMAEYPVVLFDASAAAPDHKKTALLKAHKIVVLTTPGLYALRMTRTLVSEIKNLRNISEGENGANLLSLFLNFKGLAGKGELNPKEIEEMLEQKLCGTIDFLPDLFSKLEGQGKKMTEESDGQRIIHALIACLKETMPGLFGEERRLDSGSKDSSGSLGGLLKKFTGK
ncbi:MAG: AAA family ATPase [Rhodospirillales bacterium]|nr:AAA family ATPase [Rhodospirillales bacterium]